MFGIDPFTLWLVIGVTLVAGFVKGAIGFAMPIIMISALGSFLDAHQAVALTILPIMVTNLGQSFRRGTAPAIAAFRKYWRHIVAVMVCLPFGAMLSPWIPQIAMYLVLGVPITLYALWQLSGRSMTVPVHNRKKLEVVTGIVGGLYGGIAGIWGPPIIVYLLSIRVSKDEQIQTQGVVFLLGSTVALLSHLQTGILNEQTLPLSMIAVVPACLGMMLGQALYDRLDAKQFRRWTLILLTLTGLNLVRRALELAGLPV